MKMTKKDRRQIINDLRDMRKKIKLKLMESENFFILKTEECFLRGQLYAILEVIRYLNELELTE